MPDRAELPPSLAADMPPPSVELTMIGALMRAHMACLPPRKRQEFLAGLMRVFEQYEATSNVVRLRCSKHDADVTKARREAIAWTRGMMAAFWMLDIAEAPETAIKRPLRRASRPATRRGTP